VRCAAEGFQRSLDNFIALVQVLLP
jgi:hypothetical protein